MRRAPPAAMMSQAPATLPSRAPAPIVAQPLPAVAAKAPEASVIAQTAPPPAPPRRPNAVGPVALHAQLPLDEPASPRHETRGAMREDGVYVPRVRPRISTCRRADARAEPQSSSNSSSSNSIRATQAAGTVAVRIASSLSAYQITSTSVLGLPDDGHAAAAGFELHDFAGFEGHLFLSAAVFRPGLRANPVLRAISPWAAWMTGWSRHCRRSSGRKWCRDRRAG